ncbi:MAG: MotA/TolQ/ExbB proton channel family protein [Alphaproteobacteria bacterium]|nr:MAG: MotA/TolQ/ExbB proton channel family protein [Alphaproteobacteria bacterium]
MNYFNIFAHAPISIKFILISLVAASVWSWTIIFAKFFILTRMRAKFQRFERLFWSGDSLDDIYAMLQNRKNDPVYSIFIVGMEEWGANASNTTSQIDRIETIMTAHLDRSVNDVSRGLSFLSNLGTNGVIVGLFGTVLGIMNSFQAIAQQKNTNLAVVAPGIAEALFATAVSLAASIPAAIAYNKIENDIETYANDVRCFIKEFKTIVARQ